MFFTDGCIVVKLTVQAGSDTDKVVGVSYGGKPLRRVK